MHIRRERGGEVVALYVGKLKAEWFIVAKSLAQWSQGASRIELTENLLERSR